MLWLVLSRSGFCSTTDRFPWKRSNPCMFVLERSRQIQNLLPKQRKKKGEYCHSPHWNYQKKPKRLKFFRHFKDGWRRRTFLSASHCKCILLSETECHIINNLLTALARVVLGNIGLDQYSTGEYWPRTNIPQHSPRARLVYFSVSTRAVIGRFYPTAR